jgi:hypothetical protein
METVFPSFITSCLKPETDQDFLTDPGCQGKEDKMKERDTTTDREKKTE